LPEELSIIHLHIMMLIYCNIVKTAAGKAVLLLWTYSYEYTCAVKQCDIPTAQSTLVKSVRCAICSAVQPNEIEFPFLCCPKHSTGV